MGPHCLPSNYVSEKWKSLSIDQILFILDMKMKIIVHFRNLTLE